MLKNTFFAIALFTFCAVLSCKSLTRDIEITLPTTTQQLQVECYLRPNFPYLLSLNETNDYFNSNLATIKSVTNALVTVTHQGRTDTLREINVPYGGKNITIYANPTFVPNDTINEFRLDIKTADNRILWATARIKPPVKIDSLQQLKSPTDGKYSCIAVIKDNPKVRNFYRLITYKNSRDSLPDRTVRFNDQLTNGQDIISATGYRFSPKDTLYWQLYHIEQTYYDFLQSASSASSANGNPFAQPALLRSNIKGGIGIFTGMSMTERILIIK